MAEASASVIYGERQEPVVVVVVDPAPTRLFNDERLAELLQRNDAATVIRKARLAARRRTL